MGNLRKWLAVPAIAILVAISAFALHAPKHVAAGNTCDNSSPLLAQYTTTFSYDGASENATLQLTIRGVYSLAHPSTDCIWGNVIIQAPSGDTIDPGGTPGYWRVEQGFYHKTGGVYTYAYAADAQGTTPQAQVGVPVQWLSTNTFGNDCVLINDEVSDDSTVGDYFYSSEQIAPYTTEPLQGDNVLPDVATNVCPS
jgi:hypothetical protein